MHLLCAASLSSRCCRCTACLPVHTAVCSPTRAGSTFELLAVANSRAGVNAQAFSEESLEAILPQQPASGLPVNTCLLPGVLSMQVVAEAGRADAAYTGADAAGQAGGAGGSAGSQQQQQQQHGS